MNIIFAVDKKSFNKPDHAGVNIKVNSQLEQMRSGGNTAELQQYEWVDGQLQMHVEKDTDILYFRRIESSVKLIKTLKQCKQVSPKLRIIMEIPTYPYKGEAGKRSFKQIVNGIIGDALLSKYVDRIALCGVDKSVEKVLGVKVLHFDNGVDFDSLALNKSASANDDIHMICVSGCMPSHGYDRMIEGLNKYYQSGANEKKVYFHIVGTGECYDSYVSLAKQYDLLDKYVLFHGRQTGTALDEIYSKCNLAVAHLATHRIGLTMISSLKTREYAARGIPFITSAAFDVGGAETEKYIQFVPADESPIDIEKIIEFFEKVYAEDSVSGKMRETYQKYCDWQYAYKPVIEYINRQ